MFDCTHNYEFGYRPIVQPHQLIAHRGYCHRYPENTLLAFEQAIAAGAQALEADVQLSADGAPFIFHDRELARLCGVPGRLEQKTADELAALSAYAPQQFGQRFYGEPILALAELLALVERHPGVTLYLEVKRVSLRSFSVSEVVERLWPLIWPLREQIVLISFSIRVLAEARQRGWLRVAPVLTEWSQIRHSSVRKLKPESVFLSHLRLPPLAGYPPLPYDLVLYETSDLKLANQLLGRGASRVETDDIGGMLQALTQGH